MCKISLVSLTSSYMNECPFKNFRFDAFKACDFPASLHKLVVTIHLKNNNPYLVAKIAHQLL